MILTVLISDIIRLLHPDEQRAQRNKLITHIPATQCELNSPERHDSSDLHQKVVGFIVECKMHLLDASILNNSHKHKVAENIEGIFFTGYKIKFIYK